MCERSLFRFDIFLLTNFIFFKVFSREELEFLASLCKKHNVLYISDEVYEWIVYGEKEHIRMGK